MICRISKKKSKVFLNLGKMPLANGFIKKNQITNSPTIQPGLDYDLILVPRGSYNGSFIIEQS